MPYSPMIRRPLRRLLTASLGALLAVAATTAPARADARLVGDVTEYRLTTPDSYPAGITAGPDQAVWIAESGVNRIARVTSGGAVTEYPLPTADSFPQGITRGPDRALWFTEGFADKIGRITTTGRITEFPLPGTGASPQVSRSAATAPCGSPSRERTRSGG